LGELSRGGEVKLRGAKTEEGMYKGKPLQKREGGKEIMWAERQLPIGGAKPAWSGGSQVANHQLLNSCIFKLEISLLYN